MSDKEHRSLALVIETLALEGQEIVRDGVAAQERGDLNAAGMLFAEARGLAHASVVVLAALQRARA